MVSCWKFGAVTGCYDIARPGCRRRPRVWVMWGAPLVLVGRPTDTFRLLAPCHSDLFTDSITYIRPTVVQSDKKGTLDMVSSKICHYIIAWLILIVGWPLRNEYMIMLDSLLLEYNNISIWIKQNCLLRKAWKSTVCCEVRW